MRRMLASAERRMCVPQVMGRSGAGKTTLVGSLCLSTLMQDCSGCQDIHAYAISLNSVECLCGGVIGARQPNMPDACCCAAPQLDILAANASGGRLAGDVLLNGSPRRMADYRKLSCYVMQRDVLLESATVRHHSRRISNPPAPACAATSSLERGHVPTHLHHQSCASYIIVQARIMCRGLSRCRCGRR